MLSWMADWRNDWLPLCPTVNKKTGVFIKLHCGTWHAGPLFDTPTQMDFANLELSDTNVTDFNCYELEGEYSIQAWASERSCDFWICFCWDRSSLKKRELVIHLFREERAMGFIYDLIVFFFSLSWQRRQRGSKELRSRSRLLWFCSSGHDLLHILFRLQPLHPLKVKLLL